MIVDQAKNDVRNQVPAELTEFAPRHGKARCRSQADAGLLHGKMVNGKVKVGSRSCVYGQRRKEILDLKARKMRKPISAAKIIRLFVAAWRRDFGGGRKQKARV